MRRDGIDYVECRGCGEVFESEDLEQVPIYDEEEVEAVEEPGSQKSESADPVREKKAS